MNKTGKKIYSIIFIIGMVNLAILHIYWHIHYGPCMPNWLFWALNYWQMMTFTAISSACVLGLHLTEWNFKEEEI